MTVIKLNCIFELTQLLLYSVSLNMIKYVFNILNKQKDLSRMEKEICLFILMCMKNALTLKFKTHMYNTILIVTLICLNFFFFLIFLSTVHINKILYKKKMFFFRINGLIESK